MKKIVTAVLAVMLIVSCFSFIYPTGAQDDSIMFSFSYREKTNGLVGKNAATLENVTINGVDALKITPTPAAAAAAGTKELRLDCYSLSYTARQIRGAKYMTIKYKYEGNAGMGFPMTVQFFKTGGALKESFVFDSKDKVKGGGWRVALFDISSINNNLDITDGKIFSQFHLWPLGRYAEVADMTGNQAIYIGDVSFHDRVPDIAGISVPGATDPSEPVEVPFEGDENGVLFTFNYADKYSAIVNSAKTADVTKVSQSGQTVLKVDPNPETALDKILALD